MADYKSVKEKIDDGIKSFCKEINYKEKLASDKEVILSDDEYPNSRQHGVFILISQGSVISIGESEKEMGRVICRHQQWAKDKKKIKNISIITIPTTKHHFMAPALKAYLVSNVFPRYWEDNG